MSPEQFQNQGAAHVPNTARFEPAGTVPPGMSNIKPPAVDVRGYPQAYPDDQARLTAQRRYFRGGQGPTY